MDVLLPARATVCYLDRRIDVSTAVARGIVLGCKAQARTRPPHAAGPVRVDVGAGSVVLDDRVPVPLRPVGVGPWAAVGGTLRCGLACRQRVELEVEAWDQRSTIVGLRPGRRTWRQPSPAAYLAVAVPALDTLATRLESLAAASTHKERARAAAR